MPILIINYLPIISSCNTISESTILFQFCFIQLCICTPFVMSNKKKILDMHQTMTVPRIIIKAFSFIEDSNSNLCLLLNTYNEYLQYMTKINRYNTNIHVKYIIQNLIQFVNNRIFLLSYLFSLSHLQQFLFLVKQLSFVLMMF